MKSKFVRKRGDIQVLNDKIRNVYLNRYFNLFMKYFKFDGLDANQADYLMRKFWDTGTVCAFPIRRTGELGLCQYSVQNWNMYDLPETVLLINKWNMPFFPKGVQVVNKNVVLGWINPNHKPIKDLVDLYAQRMADVDMVINTNLQLHKMPFLVATTPENLKKAEDILDRILNNEIAVFTDVDDINLLQAIATKADFIIDKLYNYKAELESELLTLLGIDNPVIDAQNVLQNITVDQENSNNALINASQETMKSCLEDFFKKVEEVLNYKITFEPMIKPVQSVYEEKAVEESEEVEDVRE